MTASLHPVIAGSQLASSKYWYCSAISLPFSKLSHTKSVSSVRSLYNLSFSFSCSSLDFFVNIWSSLRSGGCYLTSSFSYSELSSSDSSSFSLSFYTEGTFPVSDWFWLTRGYGLWKSDVPLIWGRFANTLRGWLNGTLTVLFSTVTGLCWNVTFLFCESGAASESDDSLDESEEEGLGIRFLGSGVLYTMGTFLERGGSRFGDWITSIFWIEGSNF